MVEDGCSSRSDKKVLAKESHAGLRQAPQQSSFIKPKMIDVNQN
jgi:hypothetical protein